MSVSELSSAAQDYLKMIWSATEWAATPITVGAMAERMGVKPSTVSDGIRRLAKQGLVTHAPYGSIELTQTGKDHAVEMVRRHRLLEAYLVGFLGYSWDTVHDEAERLEHAVSDVLIERMALALGNPRFDPHGDPIPDPDGVIDELVYTPLAEVPVGETVEIRRVDTSQPDRLRYLEHSGLIPGTKVTISRRQPFSGPITVSAGGQEQIIGQEIASQVLCIRSGAR